MYKLNHLSGRLLFCLALSLVLFSSCSKNKEDDPDDDDTPAGAITVDSYTPQYPIWGGEITIIGKGFGTKKEDIEVFFLGNTLDIEKTKGTVLEINNTQIKVKIPYHTKPSSLNPNEFVPDYQLNFGNVRLEIKIKGVTKFASPENVNFIWFNAAPFINSGNSIYTIGVTTVGFQIIPGEKCRISGSGFGMTKTEGVLTVNGTATPIDSIWGGSQTSSTGGGNRFIIASLPATVGSKSKDQKDYTFSYTRMGQSHSRTVKGNALPRLSITSNSLPAVVVGGTSVTDFKIVGKNLYANRVFFRSSSLPASVVIPVAVTGAALNATEVTAFVPLAELMPYGDRLWNVTLGDTEVGSTVIGGWQLGSVRVKP